MDAEGRRAYLEARRIAYSGYCNYQIETSTAALLALPEAKPMLYALGEKRYLINFEVDADSTFGHSPVATSQREIRAEQERRFSQLLLKTIE